MAYYLAFAGGGGQSGQYVAITSRIDIQSGDDFSIFIDARISANSNFYRPLGGDNVQDTSPRVLILNGGTFRLYNTAGTIRSWSTGLNLTTVETIEFRRVSGTLDLLINGAVQSGSIASNTDTFLGFQTINGNSSNASEVDNDLYRLKFTVNNVLIHDYDPSASNGTGLTLTDVVGGNNGTLTNFTGDDSQWVFYASGPTAYTITADSVSDTHTAQDVAFNYSAGSIAYHITCDAVSDSHAAGAVNFYRGYNLSADALNDSHTANDATLSLSGAWTAYTITCDAVSDSHQAGTVLLNRGYTISIDSVSDTHNVGDVTLIAGPIDYTITCEAVMDTHSAENVILRYALPSDPIDYGMSGFGHNSQWRNSIFFRGQ